MPLLSPEGEEPRLSLIANVTAAAFQVAMDAPEVLPHLPWTVYVPVGAALAGAIGVLWARNLVISDRLYGNNDRVLEMASRTISTMDANTITLREAKKLIEELHEVLVVTTPAKRQAR